MLLGQMYDVERKRFTSMWGSWGVKGLGCRGKGRGGGGGEVQSAESTGWVEEAYHERSQSLLAYP